MIRSRLRSRLAAETAWSLAHEGLGLVSMTATFLLLARHLGPTGYGAYVGLYGLLSPFTAFALSGVSMTVLEFTIREREDPADVVRSCSAVALVLGTILSALVIALALLLLNGLSVASVVLLVTAELILNSSSIAVTASIQAQQGFIAATRVRVVGIVVRLLGIVSLAVTDRMTLTNLAAVSFVVYSIFALWVVRLVRGRGHTGSRYGALRRRHLWSTFLYGFGISAVNVQNDGDKVTLNAFGHVHDAGVYGAAYRVVQMGLLPITALVSATHMSFLHIDEHSNNQLRRATRLATLAMAYASVFAVGMVLAAPLIPRFTGDSFDEASKVMPWLVPLVVLRGPGTFAMNGLLGLGRNQLRTTILVSNALFSVGLYVLLIPDHGWRGAATGTVLSEFTMACASWIALVRAQHRHDRARQSDTSVDLSMESSA